MRELETDILIVGGGTGGFAAALTCARLGVRAIVVEPTDWLGGQLTAQAVPPDENQWIETVGGTASYQEFRARVRAWYKTSRPLIKSACENPLLNPGNGWVSRLCMEPTVAHRVLREMLAPHESTGVVTVLTGLVPLAAHVSGDRVLAIEFNHNSPEHVLIKARFVLDATELGDVLELAKIEHAIGAEHHAAFGELHALADKPDPMDQQAVSWCFALEHRPGESHVIDKPKSYDFWRSYVPTMIAGEKPWTGPLFSWTVPSHNQEGRRTFIMMPWPDEPPTGEWEMWRYRRIVDRSMYQSTGAIETRPPDVSLINMVQMDYWQKPLLGVSRAAQHVALAEAREQSLSLVYWMQTEAPRHDVGRPGAPKHAGYPGLKLRGDELGTADGFAKACYIREARRLIARTIVHEGHIGTAQRSAMKLNTSEHNWSATPFGTAERFADSVGIGHYMIDLHPSTSGRNNVYVPAAPFRIPMGSLIPVRVRNVLAAGKCLGVTHITNGCYRMHHVEWNVGESAAALAAYCLEEHAEPAQVHESAQRVQDVQRMLGTLGVRMQWPWE